MNWKSIGIKPTKAHATRNAFSRASFVLNLPLLIDGRIAFTLLRNKPDEAQVRRYVPGGDITRGHVRYLNGQWTFVWALGRRLEIPATRIFGRRFLIGDKVMLKAANNPMAIYYVCKQELAVAVEQQRVSSD